MNIQFLNYEYECPDDGVWIASVSADDDVYRVYASSHDVMVTPMGTVPHTKFGWEEPAFDGLKGNIKAACLVAVAIVHAQFLVDVDKI